MSYSRTIGVKYKTKMGTIYIEQDFDFHDDVRLHETILIARKNMIDFITNYLFNPDVKLKSIAYSEPKRERK